jgi:membrane protease YdiL (CAAX protease family)
MATVRRSLPWLLFVLLVAGMARANDLRPNAPSSHEAFLSLLNSSRADTRRGIIAQYDAFLAKSPNDHLTAIERCKFIPFLIVMAVVAGILRRRTGSIATGTVLHALNNLVASFAIPL